MNAFVQIGPKYHPALIQGTDEWLQMRCGKLTASEMKLIVSPPPEVETRVKKNGELYKQREWEPCADNKDTRAHVYELLFQRMTGFVEPHYIGDDMLRGQEDEIYARMEYAKHFAPVEETGFITNDKWGFTIGYSPDGLVGNDGLIECKSRRGKFQVQTIAENEVPSEYMLQLQTGMLVSERSWCDFISYSGGLPMFVKRVDADQVIQDAIIAAATNFEMKLAEKEREYRATLAGMAKVIETERREEEEMVF